jgi:anti-sigma factor RsiW
MNHDDAQQILHEYHDGELTADQAEHVGRHVENCVECRDDLAGLQRVSALVAPLASIEDTEQFVQRVMARLPEPAPSFWRQVSIWWKVPALAMCALFLVVVGEQRGESMPSTRALLCGDNNSAAVKHLCSDDTAHSDELMNLVWGDL